MSRKVFVVSFFLLISVLNISFGQRIIGDPINVDITSEEIIRFRNNSYNIYHLDVGFSDNYRDRPILIISEIVNYLQKNNYLSAVNSSTPQKVDFKQFNWDLGISGAGAHPIFEYWNSLMEWHVIKYKTYLYIIKGHGDFFYEETDGISDDLYKINIRG